MGHLFRGQYRDQPGVATHQRGRHNGGIGFAVQYPLDGFGGVVGFHDDRLAQGVAVVVAVPWRPAAPSAHSAEGADTRVRDARQVQQIRAAG